MILHTVKFSGTSQYVNSCNACVQDHSGYLVYALLAVVAAVGMICFVRILARKLKLSFKMTWLAFASIVYTSFGYYLTYLDTVSAISLLCVWIPWTFPFMMLLMFVHHHWNRRSRRLNYLAKVNEETFFDSVEEDVSQLHEIPQPNHSTPAKRKRSRGGFIIVLKCF